MARRGGFAIAAGAILAGAIAPGWAPAALAQPQAVRFDGRAEAAAALYGASATAAAAERISDEGVRQARAQIEALRAQGARGRARLIAAQETHIADLVARDHAYAKEIAVFLLAVERIAATPEGAAALARFNAGDELGALAALDQLGVARVQPGQTRANVEIAAERRDAAALAREARARGRLDTNSVIARYEEVTRLHPNVFWDWVALSELYREAGRLPYARRAAERAATLAGEEHQRGAASYELGAVLVAQGDLAGARRRYEESLAIERWLATADQGANAERGVGEILGRIGGALAAQGDLTGARERYEESRAIAQRLAEANPSSLVAQRDFLASGLKVGEMLAAQSEFAAARRTYEESLAIARLLAEAERGSVRSQQDVAAILDRIGDALVAQGDLTGARERYAQRLAIARFLAEAEGAPASAQHNLFVCAMKIGDVLVAQGDLANARARYEEGLAIARRLAAANRSSMSAQRDVATSLGKVGDVLVGQRYPVLAHARIEEALELARTFFAQAPNSAGAEQDLAQLQFHRGELDLLLERPDDARARLRQAVSAFRNLSQRNPANMELRWALLGAEFRLAQSLADRAGVARAIDQLRTLRGMEARPFGCRWISELRQLARMEDPR